jgi:hypothetical protein
VLGQPAAVPRFARLVDDGIQAGGADRLTRTAEARRLAELGEQVTGQDRPNAVDRLQRDAASVGSCEPSQLGLERAQLALNGFDQSQQTLDVRARRRR